jgi:hypothetical protein
MKTWAIELDAEQLDMLAFCVEQMGQMLSDDLKEQSVSGYRSQCEHGEKRLGKTQLRRDIKTANAILAAVYKGQVNLAVAPKASKPKGKGGKRC